jgi:hypothetical protein
MVTTGIEELRHYHSQHRDQITSLLGEERSYLKSIIDMAEEKINKFDVTREQNLELCRVVKLQENKFGDLHSSTDADSALASKVGQALCTLSSVSLSVVHIVTICFTITSGFLRLAYNHFLCTCQRKWFLIGVLTLQPGA